MKNEELVEKIKEAIKNISRDNSKRYLKNHFLDLYQEIMEKTSFLNKFHIQENKNKWVSLFERIYCLEHGLSDRPMCKNCGEKYVNGFIKTENRYRKWCSPECQASDPECIGKSKDYRMKKYGDSNYNGLEKAKKTRFRKYNGKWNPSDQVEKTKKTKLKRYGSEKYTNTGKTKSTKLERYGSCGWNNPQKRVDTTKRKHFRNHISKNSFSIPLFSEEEYSKSKIGDLLKWKCRRCGLEFTSNIDYNIRYATNSDRLVKCPKCDPRKVITNPKEENDLYEFLKSLGNFQRNNRKIIKPLEVDFLCEEKRIAIEFDGLYWHSDIKKDPGFHLKKTKMCKERGFRLIHLFEDEWIHKREIVKSYLRRILGVFEIELNGDDCIIKELKTKEKDDFLTSHDVKGTCKSSVNLGMFYKNELISVMTFGRSRFSKKHEWEILRFCENGKYKINKGGSRLLNFFETKFSPISIMATSDLRWENGDKWKELGFEIYRVTKPNYWYIDFINMKRINRMSFRKTILPKILRKFDQNLSEKDNMKKYNFGIIYDCGKIIFSKTKKTG